MMAEIGLYDIATSTTPESNKSLRREEHDRHNKKVARIQCAGERLLPSKSVPVRSLKVRLQPFSLQR